MPSFDDFEKLKKEIKKITGEWKTVKGNVKFNGMNNLIESAATAADVIDTGLSYIDKIIGATQALLYTMATMGDLWKMALNMAIDSLSNLITEGRAVHFISIPPLVMVKHIPEYSKTIKYKSYRLYNPTMLTTDVFPYVNPINGEIVPGINAYDGKDLYPYYNIIRESIIDVGDIAAPRFETKKNYWATTAIIEVGANISDLFRLAVAFRNIPLLMPKTSINTFKIYVKNIRRGILVNFDSDTIMTAIAFSGLSNQFKLYDFNYKLYRTNNMNTPSKIVHNGTLSDLFKNNWSIIDTYDDRGGKSVFYDAIIENKQYGKIMYSNTASVYCDSLIVVRNIRSVPPDWAKISLSTLLVGEEIIDKFFTIIRSIINTLNSICKSWVSVSIDNLDNVRNIISFLREWIEQIEDILRMIQNIFKVLGQVKIHTISNYNKGDYTDLIQYYKNILVLNPPPINTSVSDNIVYMVSIVGDAGTADVLEVLNGLFSVKVTESKTMIDKAFNNLESNISDFRKWLDSATLRQ